MQNKKIFNYNTGAYGNLTHSQLQNIALPPKIKCDFCKKSKPHQTFNQAQLAKVRSAIYKSGQSNARYNVRCIPCSGGQLLELVCVECKAWKGLEHFSKQQRKTPDAATCKPCMEERLAFDPREVEPMSANSDSDSDDCSESDSEDNESDDDVSVTTHTDASTSTINNGLSGLSVNGTTTGSIGSSRVASSYLSSTNTTRNGFTGGVALRGSETNSAAKNYGIPRSRTVATSSATASNSDGKNSESVAPLSQKETSDTESTTRNHEWQSDSDEDVVHDSDEDEDSDDDSDDDDDDRYNGSWQDGNTVGY